MKLIATVKLQTDKAQFQSLKRTLERANECCNFLSRQAFRAQQFQRYAVQKSSYHAARERFGLTAQMVIRCIAKVCDAYALDKIKQRTFKPLGSIAYDDRILR